MKKLAMFPVVMILILVLAPMPGVALASATPLSLQKVMTYANLLEGSHSILAGIYEHFGYGGAPSVNFTMSYDPSSSTFATGLNSYILTDPVERDFPGGGSIPVSLWDMNLTGSGTLSELLDGRDLVWSASWNGTLEPVLIGGLAQATVTASDPYDLEPILISATDTGIWLSGLEKDEYVALAFNQNGQLQKSGLSNKDEWCLIAAAELFGLLIGAPEVGLAIIITKGIILVEDWRTEVKMRQRCERHEDWLEMQLSVEFRPPPDPPRIPYGLSDDISTGVDIDHLYGTIHPEPATLSLLALGGLVLLRRRRRRR